MISQCGIKTEITLLSNSYTVWHRGMCFNVQSGYETSNVRCMSVCVRVCVCGHVHVSLRLWLCDSGSRWLQWKVRWSCNRMKVALFPSASHTNSVRLSDDWLQSGVDDGWGDFCAFLIYFLFHLILWKSWPLQCRCLLSSHFPDSVFISF